MEEVDEGLDLKIYFLKIFWLPTSPMSILLANLQNSKIRVFG